MRRRLYLTNIFLLLSPALLAAAEDIQMLRQRYDALNERLWYVRIIFFVLLILIIFIFRYLRLKDRRRREEELLENERILSIVEDLQKRLDEAENASIPKGHTVLEKMGLGVLESLCEQYYIYEGTDNLQPKLLKAAKSAIEDLRLHPEKLESALEEQKNGIVSKFKAQISRLSDDEIRLFCFLCAGFNSTTISTLMEKDKQYIYNRIWRLKNKIMASGAPDRSLFLEPFSKKN